MKKFIKQVSIAEPQGSAMEVKLLARISSRDGDLMFKKSKTKVLDEYSIPRQYQSNPYQRESRELNKRMSTRGMKQSDTSPDKKLKIWVKKKTSNYQDDLDISNESYMGGLEEFDEADHITNKQTNRTRKNQLSKELNHERSRQFDTLQQMFQQDSMDIDTNKYFDEDSSQNVSNDEEQDQGEQILEKLQKSYDKKYERNPHSDFYSLQMVHVSDWEEIIQDYKLYHDEGHLLGTRKLIVFIYSSFSLFFQKIILSQVFIYLMLVIISANLMIFSFENFGNNYSLNPGFYDYMTKCNIQIVAKIVFLLCYIVEHVMKIIGLGLLGFLDEFWNVYDLFIVILYGLYVFYPTLLAYDLSPFRAMRILIYIGRISKKLGIMLLAISESMKFLLESSLIVMLFCTFFANVGVHLMRGQMYNKCVHLETGIFAISNQMCGARQCPVGYDCYRAISNDEQPSNLYDFVIDSKSDHFIFSFAQTLRVVSQDDWSRMMFYTMDTFSYWIWIYYVLDIFICGYFAFNLVLAVLRTYYGIIASQYNDDQVDILDIEPQKTINLRYLKHIGLYNTVKTLQQFRLKVPVKKINSALNNNFGATSTVQKENPQPILESKEQIQSGSKPPTFKSFAQISGVSKFLNKAKAIKNRKKIRLLLSARQKRDQEKKLSETAGMQDEQTEDVYDAVKNWTLKRCLIPKRKMNLEKKLIDHKFENDEKGMKIIKILQNNDILAWKVDVSTNMPFSSNSEKEVLSHQRVLTKKNRIIENQYIFIQQSNPQMFYIPVIKRTNLTMKKIDQIYEMRRSAPSLSRLLSHNSSIGSRSYVQKFPLRQSNRVVLNRTEQRKLSMKQKRAMKMSNKLKQTVSQGKAPQIHFEMPEFLEGQDHILLNGVKWNYRAMQMLMNRKIPIEHTEDFVKNYSEKYLQLRTQEASYDIIKKHNYSAYEVLHYYPISQDIKILKSMNDQAVIIWMVGIAGLGKVFRKYVVMTLSLKEVRLFFDLCTTLNIAVLCLQGYIDFSQLVLVNNIFSALLLVEIFMKIISQGIKRYARKTTNIIEFLIVSICVAEIILSAQSQSLIGPWLWQERNLMRACKMLMCYRIINYSSYAVRIMTIAYEILPTYGNLTFLLVYIILIFAIIGMEFFSKAWDESTIIGQIHTYKSVLKSWMTTFDISTNDDWYGVLRQSTQYSEQWIAIIYVFAVVIIIDYVIFGLVLAVLLDAFSKKYDQEEQFDDTHLLHEKVGINQMIELSEEEISFKSIVLDQIPVSNVKLDDSPKHSRSTTNRNPDQISQFTMQSIRQSTTSNYKNIECENSLYLFHFDHIVRQFCLKVSQTIIFKLVVNSTLILTTILLIYDTYVESDYIHSMKYYDGWFALTIFICNITTLVCYSVKVIAKGLIMDEGTFCKDIWGAFDLIYLFCYFLNYGSNQPILEIAQYMIFFRPIIILNMFRSLDGIKNALALSLKEIISLLAVLIVVWVIFAIFGINLYQGKLGYCGTAMNYNVGKPKCLAMNQTWTIYKHNFENLGQALPTLFVIATLDQWDEILQMCFNSNDENFGPVPFNNQVTSYIFFFLFVFIGSQFFIGFFTGVLFSGFQKYTRQLENKALNLDQQQFQKIAEIILKEIPRYSSAPTSFLRKFSYSITNNRIYKNIFICALFSNIIILSLMYQKASHEYLTNWNLLYQAWSIFFALDTTLKLLTYGLVRYFGTTWRLIEFFVSVAAIVDLALDYQLGWFQLYLTAQEDDPHFVYLRLFCIVRDTRIILIIQEFKGLQRLLRVLDFCLKFLFQILFIYFSQISLYALLACQLFGGINGGNTMDNRYVNFHNFGNAMLVLFKCSTVDNWREIMTDCTYYNPTCAADPTQCGTLLAYPFFISYVMFTYYILLNLFVLTLVDQFESFFKSQASVIQTYIENIDHFCNIWCKFSQETSGVKMHSKFVARFLIDLGQPLGSQVGDNIWDTAKYASSFRIRADTNGYVHFNETLYEIIRYAFKDQVFKTGLESGIIQMKQFDRNMRFSLLQKSNKIQNQDGSTFDKQAGNFNMLKEYMNVLIAFKTLEIYSQKLYHKAEGCVMIPQDFSESVGSSDIEQINISLEDNNHQISLDSYAIIKLDHITPKLAMYQEAGEIRFLTSPTENQKQFLFQPAIESQTSRQLEKTHVHQKIMVGRQQTVKEQLSKVFIKESLLEPGRKGSLSDAQSFLVDHHNN